jgi:pteridine reductase
MLTRALARELGPEIRVNAIAPGPVLWPEQAMDESLKQRIVERTALKRSGTPEDVAQAAIFFATGAPFVTGEVLAVDGGRLSGSDDR